MKRAKTRPSPNTYRDSPKIGKRKNRYNLRQLMQGHDPNAPIPTEIMDFLMMKPVGLEILPEEKTKDHTASGTVN